MRRTIAVGVWVLVLAGIALAADFWNSKPYTKWSQTEAIRLLTDSPWAKTTVLPVGTAPPPMRSANNTSVVDETQVQPTVRYSISLRSAMPVRQAVARMAAITKKYDKMDAAAQQEFDGTWNKFMGASFPDVIVVTIGFQSAEPMLDRQLLLYFQAQTLETMKGGTKLTFADGRKLDPVGFSTGPHEMQVVFPRPAELPPTASFTVEFQHPPIGGEGARRISARFQLKDMNFGGAPTL